MPKEDKEIISDLIDEQKAVLFNREATLNMLLKMPPGEVLTEIFDYKTMEGKKILVKDKTDEVRKNLEIDRRRLEALQSLYKGCTAD